MMMSVVNGKKQGRSDSPADADSWPNDSKRRRTDAGDSTDSLNLGQNGSVKKLTHDHYVVGWICALPIEMAAAAAMLDETHDSLKSDPSDGNVYTLGRIGQHNIVIACLPTDGYGTTNAATVANNMSWSFPSIQVRLMVGIGGGVPGKVDVRLGDVVVSNEVVQYDIGKTGSQGFQRTHTSFKPPPALRTAVSKLRADHELRHHRITAILLDMLRQHSSMTKYAHRHALQDWLFESTYDHVTSIANCESCDGSKRVDRPVRNDDDPKIHYGVIASGNQVMKSGRARDQLAQDLGAICFEMEAAGLMEHFPCLVVRGICDYSYSHKNKKWQEYAAAVAAAYAKELLSIIPKKTWRVSPHILSFANNSK